MLVRIVTLCLVLCACVCAQPSGQLLTMEARCDTQVVYPGELAPCVVTLRNTGQSTVHYLPGRIVWEVRYKGPDGRTATMPAFSWRSEETLCDPVMHLRAGKVFREETYCEQLLEGREVPGRYRHEFMLLSEGKATVSERQRDRLKRETQRPWDEKDDDADEDQDLGEIVEIDVWKGKISANVLEVELKELSSADDKAAYALLNPNARIGWSFVYRDFVAMEEVLKKYPKSVYARDCAWYLAERAFEVNRRVDQGWKRVVPLYQRVIDNYPVFQFTDDAKLRLAQIYRDNPEAGGVAKAKAMLEDILKNHAQSTSADEAKEMLTKLNAKSKSASAPAATVSPRADLSSEKK